MRKNVGPIEAPAVRPAAEWLNLGQIASVDVTSEDPIFPIEHALGVQETTGWRSAAEGPQIIRLRFDTPQTLQRIHLHFIDRASERSQEFAVFAGANECLREVVRQQWSFSPSGATEESEEYQVDLQDIVTFEIRIDPDRSHDPAKSQSYASMQRLRLA